MERTAGPILVGAAFFAALLIGGLIGASYPQSQQPGAEHWLTDASGFFTFALVVVGAVQAGMFVWQLSYMRRSLEDANMAAQAAKTAAEAASLQARAAVAQSQPLIALVAPQIEFWFGKDKAMNIANPGDLLSGVYATIKVHNAGGGPARLQSATADWFIGNDPPPYPRRGNYFPLFHVLKKDFTLELNFSESACWLSDSQIVRIEEGTATLWFYGALRFVDVLGETFEQGFVAHWEQKATGRRSTGRGVVVEGPATYNALIEIDS